MARTYSWHRGRIATPDYQTAGFIYLDEQDEGYTLMRSRFGIEFVDEVSYSFAHILKNPSTYGVILKPTADSASSPSIDVGEPWIWWEGIYVQPFVQPLTSPNYTKSIGPLPFQIRESQSRRVVPAGGGRIWLAWDYLNTLADEALTQYFAVDMWWEFLWLSPGP